MQAEARRTDIDERTIAELADYFETRPIEELLDWAGENHGGTLTQACSFGLEDVALVDLHASRLSRPDIFYLNTGFLFRETLATRDRLRERYGIDFREILPRITVAEQDQVFGEQLFARAPGQCCWLRKVEPLRRALDGYTAWITGIRRDQAPTRARAKTVEWDEAFGLLKINPLVRWTAEDVKQLVSARSVPTNPLHEQGYPSVGCTPCTSPVAAGEDPRSGRWRGLGKVECGLHPMNGGTS